MFNWLKNLKSQMSNTDVTVSKQSAVPRQPIKRSNPHRILICDDVAFMRMMLKNILTKNGYEVVAEAQDGLEAIERYSEFKPDLVFMDIDMPKMNGIDAMRKIMKRDSHANIVIYSAMEQQKSVMEQLVIEALRLGAKDFIIKPFTPERILKTVAEIFEPRRTATPPKETEQSQNVDTTTAPPVQAQYKQKKSGHKENEQIQAKSYIDALREQYEQYGDFALLEGKICAFIKNHKYYNVTANKVREDLEKIVKWNKLKNEIATIDNTQSYLNALKLFCTEFGSNMSSLDMRMNFVKDYQLDTKFQIDSMAVREDIIHMISEPQEFLIGNNRQLYLELLKYYYESYGDAMFYSSEIEKFESTCSKHNLNIQSYDIAEDLRTIRKEEKNTSKLNYNESIMPPVQKQHVQSQTPPEETEQNQAASQTPPVQKQTRQSQTVRTTPPKQAQNKQSVNSAKSEIEYPNLADIKGKVLEVVWFQGTDDNGFFDYFADAAKKILPSWGKNIVPQNDRQKSIVVRDNEYWVCQYFFNQYDISPDGIVEYNLHMDSKGQISVVWDDTIPDTDIYRTGTAALWTVLGDFISLPISDVQKRNIKTLIKTLSQDVFVYEEQYHDIRSYSLGRSATIEEIAMLLSLKDVWAKIEPVRK